jgi:hypothetical protein
MKDDYRGYEDANGARFLFKNIQPEKIRENEGWGKR